MHFRTVILHHAEQVKPTWVPNIVINIRDVKFDPISQRETADIFKQFALHSFRRLYLFILIMLHLIMLTTISE